MSFFSSLIEFMFSWLPSGLWVPVCGVLSVAFLIIMVKVLTAIVTVISKLVFLFIP